jgi:hypothetical protein
MTSIAWHIMLLLPALALASEVAGPVQTFRDFEAPPHNYKTRQPRDRFTLRMEGLQSDPRLDRSSEKAFLMSFLNILEIPASSQLLVYSTTSLQLRFISPSNPRAIYFSEDIYVGYIPGGRLEIVGVDPELGAIFYIFDIPRNGDAIRYERSERCMNCHAGEDTGYIPGLVAKSVIPGPGGGSLDAFRIAQSGHGIPLTDRFGGWHVTGKFNLTNHWGNLTGRFVEGHLRTFPNLPGNRFDFGKYAAHTSDILAHLLLEHQVGFVNRSVEAGYRTRTALFLSNGELTPAQSKELDGQARILTRYLLFADEAPLPLGGIKPDEAYQEDFLANRRRHAEGASLKDLDLETRLFKHRCSYMIYSPAFQGLPSVLKARIYSLMRKALTADADSEFAYLPASEKRTIRSILKSTLDDLPVSW